MSGFTEFPKAMTHPHARPAVCSTIFPLGYKPRPGEFEHPGSPAQFPPVTVNNLDQQLEYEAKGYRPQEGNSEAFDQAQSAPPAGYAYNEYPKWVRTHDGEVLVHTKEEEHQLLGYNTPKTENVQSVADQPAAEAKPKNKGGRPKGSGKKPAAKKPVHDHMATFE